MNYPKTRQEAIEQGLPKYHPDELCKHGHDSPRYVRSYSCCECHKSFTAGYRTKEEAKKTARAAYEKRRVESPEQILYYSAKARARKIDVPFEIEPKDIREVWPEDNICPVLGLEMRHNFDAESGCCAEMSPTLDRIVPSLGYVKGNIIVISLHANKIKTNETDPEVFRKVADWLESILPKVVH